jgi:hypothetical protein
MNNLIDFSSSIPIFVPFFEEKIHITEHDYFEFKPAVLDNGNPNSECIWLHITDLKTETQ